MTTTTLTNTISLADLINETGLPMNMAALQVTGQHDGTNLLDGAARKFSDMNLILSQLTGLAYTFPSVFKMRETTEWETGVAFYRGMAQERLKKGIVIDGPDVVGAIGNYIHELTAEMEALDSSFDHKMAVCLPTYLCGFWAIADAFCMEFDGKLWEQGDEPHRFFQRMSLDIYGVGGRNLASRVWDYIETAHNQGVANRLAASNAKKHMSTAAKKKARAKAAKKARKR